MSVDTSLLYIAPTLAAAVRGIAILKQLGAGTLITPYRHLAESEGVGWFGGLLGSGKVYVWDREGTIPARRGVQISLGIDRPEMDLSIPLEIPVVPRPVSALDAEAANAWWQAPIAYGMGGKVRMASPAEGPRVLVVNRPGPPGARRLGTRSHFYWPAMELMTVADEVIGGRQSMAEWDVVQGEQPDDGAARVADQLRSFLGG